MTKKEKLNWLSYSLAAPAIVLLMTFAGTGLSLQIFSKQNAELEQQHRHRAKLRMDITAEHLKEYFQSVHLIPEVISQDENIQTTSDVGNFDYLQTIYDTHYEQSRLAEIYVIKRTFDGTRAPWLTFERGDDNHEVEELHNLESEEYEYHVQMDHIRQFANDPGLERLISSPVVLCADEMGLVYSVPIRRQGQFVGIVSGMMPLENLARSLEISDGSFELLLVCENGTLITCDNIKPRTKAWFQSQFETQGIAEFFAGDRKEFTIDGHYAMSTQLEIKGPDKWYLAILNHYDQAAVSTGMASENVQYAFSGLIFLLGLLTTSLCINLQKRTLAEKSLRQSKNKYKTLYESSHDSIILFDLENGIFEANQAALKLFRYSDMKQLISKSITDISPKFQANQVTSNAKALNMINTTLEKNSHCFEWEFLNADNNPFFASIMLSKIDIDNKTIFQASIRDITNRKRINEMLEKKQKDLKSILNAAPVGMLLINNDMVIKQANNAILDLLGRDYKHVLKQKAGKALGCKNIPIDKDECGHTLKCKNCKLRQTVQNVLNTKESVQGLETKITLNANGKDVTVHINLSVEPIMLNNKTHAILAVNDITERKLAEKRQGKLLEELESANRELKDFAYIVSHDLKAPLRGIRTLADWLMTDYAEKLGTDAKDQFDLLLKRVTRMHNLIEGILQYSRVGRIKEEKTEIDVNELVKNAIDMIDPPENIEISVEDQMPVLKGQTTRLMQIFTNLISNAVKYMDKPNGSIRIGCIEEQDFWTFSVSDNGPGIEDKHFERIFQIFQTLTPRDQYESTGIGLTITKKIIELYGGRIWLQSVHGEGTTFFFTLPKSENELINTKKIEAITAC